jgi:hypothetical protein
MESSWEITVNVAGKAIPISCGEGMCISTCNTAYGHMMTILFFNDFKIYLLLFLRLFYSRPAYQMVGSCSYCAMG